MPAVGNEDCADEASHNAGAIALRDTLPQLMAAHDANSRTIASLPKIVRFCLLFGDT